MNEKTMKYYAAALCGIIAIFTFLHWTRRLVSKVQRTPTPLTYPFIAVSR